MMSVLLQENQSYKLLSKGAPENILKNCSHFVNNLNQVESLNEKLKSHLKDSISEFGLQGYRVIALSYKDDSLSDEL